MKTQNRFVISGMFKTLKFLGICLTLAALFASGAKAQADIDCEQEPLYIDPGTIGNGAKDFTVFAPSLRCITILWTDNKTLEYGDGTHFWLTPGAPFGGVYAVTFLDENLEVIKQDIQCTNGAYEDGQALFSGGTMFGPNNPIPWGFVDWGFVDMAPCRSASVIRGIFVEGAPVAGVADFDWNWDNEDRPVVGQLQAGGNQPPIAEAGEPVTGTAGEPVTFNGSGSFDPEGGSLTYDWDFGDGSTGTGAMPSHTYATSNTYNVTLTVTDDADVPASDTVTATIGANSTPPTANPAGPYTGTAGVAVLFDGSQSSSPDDSPLQYDWDFGDGSTGTGATPSHTYADSGEYPVVLTVTDDDGETDSDTTTATITIPNQPPVANAGQPVVGSAGMAANFDGSLSTDLDGDIVQYDWYFGDGFIALDAGPTPTHTYAEAGLYSVTLTVTDDDGLPASDSTTALIGESSQPPTADANGPYNGQVGVAVTFDGTRSSDPDGDIASYDWVFGDGNTGTGPTPKYDYSEAGKYIVQLTVTDSSGETDTDTTVANVGRGNLPPQADAGDKVSGEAGRRITFDGTRSSDPDGSIKSYEWDFGDGNTGTGRRTTHRYVEAGNYFVTLTVTDSDDATDSDATLATISSRLECVQQCRAERTECLNAADATKAICIAECGNDPICKTACRNTARAAKSQCRAEFSVCRAACRL